MSDYKELIAKAEALDKRVDEALDVRGQFAAGDEPELFAELKEVYEDLVEVIEALKDEQVEIWEAGHMEQVYHNSIDPPEWIGDDEALEAVDEAGEEVSRAISTAVWALEEWPGQSFKMVSWD